MTSFSQRQAAFDKVLTDVARRHAERLGVGFAGTIRKLPPPPFPGEKPGITRYYVNTVARDGGRAGLVELVGSARDEIHRAATWAETGKGPAPSARGKAKLKRKD